MRATPPLLTLAVLAALGACHRHASAPQAASAQIALPATGAPQAPGFWEQKVADRRGEQVTRYCLDGGAGAALAVFDRQLGDHCSRRDMAQAADGSWHFATSCDMGPEGKVATEGFMHGDFRSHYVVEATSQTVGAANPAANGPARITAEVSRLGACPAGVRPGDLILPDGSRSRLEALGGAHA